MKIRPIAADSLGTRSMATYVETEDVKILIDPSSSLAPDRWGLEPHPQEIKRWKEHWQAIIEHAKIAEVIVITHYHYDHHFPKRIEVFKDKIVLIKDPEYNINLNQKRRAAELLTVIKDVAKKIEVADCKRFDFGKTRVKFSPPVFHGKSNRLGYVIEVAIEAEEKFLFTSDVQGPLCSEQLDFILKESPDIVYLDGPLTYMLGSAYKKSDLTNAINNIEKILMMSNLKTLIIDHHLLRDREWRERVKRIFNSKYDNVNIVTAAGFLGKEDETLEAHRKALYGVPDQNEKGKMKDSRLICG